MIQDHLDRFDFWDFEPDTQFERRGTTETPFPYPYRDNVMRLWEPTRAYVESYLRLYYDRDEDVAKDSQLVTWAADARPAAAQRRRRPDRRDHVRLAGARVRDADPRVDRRARRPQQRGVELLDARLAHPDRRAAHRASPWTNAAPST